MTAVLATKLHVPVPRRRLVPRTRLTERLTDLEDPPRLVLVTAPAGFGKTTLLSQWLSRDSNRRVAWVSLDAEDGDMRRFLVHVVTALHRAHNADDDRVGAEALALLEADGPTPDQAVLTSLLNDLDEVAEPVVLALDDYHLVEGVEVHQAVAFLLDHLPATVTVAIATRADPPLPVARLRTRGELLELRAADLRFTTQEADAFLNEVMEVAVEPPVVAALDRRTEGWAAGLQLAALSLRGRDDVEQFVAAFTGSHRFVVDYLAEEVLERQSERVRDFLLETSLLRELDAALCDALTGRDDGRELLAALDRADLFVVPLDGERRRYRYHHLFADVLQARLHSERPERVPELHRAASRWLTRHGDLDEGFRHAVAGGDLERAADAFEVALPGLRRDRRTGTLRAWLAAVPAEVAKRRPLLGTTNAWLHLTDGDLDAMGGWLDAAEAALHATVGQRHPDASPAAVAAWEAERRALPSTIAMYRASAAQARGDTAATVEHARRALELAGPDDHAARGAAAGFLALAAWAGGDLRTAVDTFTVAVASLRAAGGVADALGSTVVLAEMWVARGRPAEARRLYEEALSAAHSQPAPVLPVTGDLHVGLADLLREADDVDAARHHLLAADELGDAASLPENRHRRFVASAGLLRATGDLDGAVRMLDEAEAAYRPGFFPDTRPVAAVRARVHVAQGRLAEAWEWARRAGVTVQDPPSYLAEHAQLTLVRLLLAEHRSGSPEVAQDDLDGALTVVDRVLEDARAEDRTGSVIEALLLRALVKDARGDAGGSLVDLEESLALGVPAGFVRLFLDEGPPLLDLLGGAARPARSPHAERLLDVARRSRGSGRVLPHGEQLSPRELEVLRLLATDLTGPDIARSLFVSVNTLRTHTKRIFTKLDVTTRQAAVRRAGDIGLL